MLRRFLVPGLFTLTLFTSAGLLFMVQPMVAKMILPLLGGTPAVWNTCMMFFQALLLAGYLYAHFSASSLSALQQIVLHTAILGLALLVLPVAISREWLLTGESHPILVVLVLLITSVGLPFFILSASAPLLQKWFAGVDHPAAKNPYFLYSASNAGSMLALIGYPGLIEPGLTLKEQGSLWTLGYGALLALTIGCAVAVWRASSKVQQKGMAAPDLISLALGSAPAEPISPGQRLRWVALSFVPSSLMLGVTSYLGTDIAAIPLLWVIPLSLYLLSFILVFAELPERLHRVMLRLFPAAIVLLLAMNFSDEKPALWIVFLVNLAVFFIIAMACHGELARSRPSAHRLTEFYLLMSLGGVLGGVFNAVIAPLVFDSVIEYPLVLALSPLLLPLGKDALLSGSRLHRGLDIGIPALLGAASFLFILKAPASKLDMTALSAFSGIGKDTLAALLTYGPPALLCYALVTMKRMLRFSLGVVAFAAALVIADDWNRDIVHQERSFFGVIRVITAADAKSRYLVHGGIQHGKQSLDPALCDLPITYYHPDGPVGQIFDRFRRSPHGTRFAVIGLGIGTLAGYGEPGEKVTFYEIDPAVRRVATNPALFTYLKKCRAEWDIVIGDARLRLEEAPPGSYGLMLIDAFSSDSIPVHLLTREALALYFSRLADRGLLAVHISNKYLDLEPVLGRLARDAGLAGRIRDDDEEDSTVEKYRSTWVALARQESDLGAIAGDGRWRRLKDGGKGAVWTDDFSNILGIFKWN